MGGYNEMSLADTDGVAFSMFFQGCKKRCKNCHNPELQPFNGGEETMTDQVVQKIKKNLSWYDSVAFIGGEPMEQPEALKEILKEVKVLGLERWLYTGYEADEIPEDIKELCSVIIAGEYREDLHTGGFPASSNQQIIDYRR